MCHRPIIANLGRVCQISVDRFSSIDNSMASCHDWGVVPFNLPLSNVQISDTSDIVGSRDYTCCRIHSTVNNNSRVSQPSIVLDPLSWRISKSCVEPSHTEPDTLILVDSGVSTAGPSRAQAPLTLSQCPPSTQAAAQLIKLVCLHNHLRDATYGCLSTAGLSLGTAARQSQEHFTT